jgi:hypothetical protein
MPVRGMKVFRVQQVNDSRRGMRDFVSFPYGLYRRDGNWCPPLRLERKRFFSPHNPFVRRNRIAFFVAYDRDRPVGRVTAHIDDGHNLHWHSRHAFFGFYESADNMEVSEGLMQSAEAWARSNGMRALSGPYNFNTKQEVGFLEEGFEAPPVLMMPYTKKYYLELFRQLGYRKEKALLSYRFSSKPEALDRIEERLLRRHGDSIRIVPLNRRDLQSEHGFILDIYNDAWSRNWGFIPMTEEELSYLIREMKPFGDVNFVYKLYKDGEPAAFMLNLPNINEVLMKIRSGRLLPTGIFRLLLHRRLIRSGVIVIMGVKSRYHRLGLDALLVQRLIQDRWRRPGVNALETTWILEDNFDMIRSLRYLGAEPIKRYAILQKDLS